MPPTGYPQRIAHVPGPVLSPAFWGGSLFTFCAHYTLTDDARSHYGPQCACVLRAGVVAGHQVNLGDVYCHEIDYSGPYDNRAFFLPLHVSLVNLCRTHCHCSQILPINTIIPGDRGFGQPTSSGIVFFQRRPQRKFGRYHKPRSNESSIMGEVRQGWRFNHIRSWLTKGPSIWFGWERRHAESQQPESDEFGEGIS